MNNKIPEKEEPSAMERAIEGSLDILLKGLQLPTRIAEIIRTPVGGSIFAAILIIGSSQAIQKYNSPESIATRLEKSNDAALSVLEMKEREAKIVGTLKNNYSKSDVRGNLWKEIGRILQPIVNV